MKVVGNISKKKFQDWDDIQLPIIRYKGVFDWSGLYRYCKFWIEDNRYKFHEKRYKHKWDEIEVDIQGERKLDEMHRNYIDIGFHIWNYKEIEVIENGKKVKRGTGRVEVKIHTDVQVDYSGRFNEGKFAQLLGNWWMTIRSKEFEANYLEKYTYEVYRLHQEIKILLNMETDSNAF